MTSEMMAPPSSGGAGPRAAPGNGRPDLIAAFGYLAIVIVLWAPHTLYSGLPYETGFPYVSDTSSWLMGFLYTGDPLRIHTNFFYQVSYLLGEATGVGGSYVPYQVVHAFLWWARGMLVFLLIRRLLPDQPLLAYVAGALVLVHAADGALQFAGQINQFGFIFWMLLACYASVRAIDAVRAGGFAGWTAGAVLFAHMSLWSYESQLPLMLVWPAVLVWLRGGARRRALAVATCWYFVMAVYVGLTLATYMGDAGATSYQAGQMRHNWSVGAIASDWWFNVSESLFFWRWRRMVADNQDLRMAAIATAVFVAGAGVLYRMTGRPDTLPARAGVRTLAAVFGVGVMVLVLSFPVYLVLESARGLWRTQLLSGVGAAVTLAGGFALASRPLGRRLEHAALTALGAAVIWVGSAASLELGAHHRADWERHRAIMSEVIRTVPSVKPNTVVAVVNVPKAADPFGHNMWLDLPTRLVYPKTPVVGLYFLDDGSPSPGNNMILDGSRWFWDGTGFPPDVRDTTLARTVVVSLDSTGRGTLATTLPQVLCRVTCSRDQYDPASVLNGSMSDRAARRYRLNASK